MTRGEKLASKTALKAGKFGAKLGGKLAKKIIISVFGALGFFGTFLILVVSIFLSVISGSLSSSDDYGNSLLSSEVEAYRNMMTTIATEYGIPEYVDLLLAIMMQESSGLGNDPMQSSACAYNILYPDGIVDPYYSIECGVQTFRDALTTAGATGPDDMEAIKLALQGYNFGGGYITWAIENYGGYTAESAIEFSEMKMQQLGWKIYGDTEYVPHVLRYYNTSSSSGTFAWPVPGHTNITSGYGMRSGKMHKGIDISDSTVYGADIAASDSGTVVVVMHNAASGSGYGGYGNVVVVDHGNGYRTLYAHCSSIAVAQGDSVSKGQTIAYVGNSGNSTGPHLHFEIRTNSSTSDPQTVDPQTLLNTE